MRRCVCAAREAMDEVVRRPWAGELQVAFAHHGAGCRELVLVALDAFAIDQVRDIEQHFAALGHAAAHFFIQRREHAVHLEADGARSGLAFALPRCIFAQVGEVLLAYAFQGQMLVQFFAAAGIYVDFQVHFRFAMEALQIALKLALIGADRLAQSFIILKDGAKTERENS